MFEWEQRSLDHEGREDRGASRKAGLEECSHLENLREEGIGKFIKP